MTPFAHQALGLFIALRLGDAINIAAGLWLVPCYIATEDLGAVLPATSFATFLAIPAFAFGFIFMREATRLACAREYGKLKSLVRGVFAGIGCLLLLALAVAACLMPGFLGYLRVPDSAAGFLVIASAFLGCVAPVYMDALNALKRFKAVGTIEIISSAARFLALLVLLPIRAFAGYFAGGAVQPLVRIMGALLALRRELSAPAEPFWSKGTMRRIAILFIGVTAYLSAPMFAGLVEQTLLRTELTAAESAGYYLATRLTDVLNTITFPLLLVLFPYASEATEQRSSIRPLVLRCSAVTLAAAAAFALVCAICGEKLLALLPNGCNALPYARHLPLLIATSALTACQNFCTNAEIAAGRFGFLAWFIPLHLAYPAALYVWARCETLASGHFLAAFAFAALLRFLGAAVTLHKQTRTNSEA